MARPLTVLLPALALVVVAPLAAALPPDGVERCVGVAPGQETFVVACAEADEVDPDAVKPGEAVRYWVACDRPGTLPVGPGYERFDCCRYRDGEPLECWSVVLFYGGIPPE